MQSHPTQYHYTCNSETTALYKCRRYRLANSATSETVTLDGFYKAGALDVTRATDPDGCTLLTFTDWRGIKILERRVLTDSQFADTYYLYDVLGNVRVIIQPEGTALIEAGNITASKISRALNLYSFIYRYDRRGNCIYSKVPGGGAVEKRYDALNRLAFSQTAIMREDGTCELYLYDSIGRPTIQSIGDLDIPDVEDVPLMTTARSSADSIGYTLPDGIAREQLNIASVYYYDDYSYINRSEMLTGILGALSLDSSTAKGNKTGERHILYSGDHNKAARYSVYNYDTEGNATATYNIVNGELVSKGEYTFTRQGKPLSKDITLDDNQCNYSHTMEYDSSGFLKKETVSGPYIGFHNQRTAVEYNYNSLGQIASKYFDIRTTVQYQYNLRGQLTSIQSPFFAQNIKYETGTTPCYNGNISEYTVSYNGGEAVKRAFSYDCMNRLTAMTSSDGFNTAYTYNLNSSPLTIQRYGLTSDGTVGLIDDLTLKYSGNQLTRVDDAADPVILENSSDFHSAEAEYSYDSDGRLIADTGRGITNIEYSPIGKPLKISFISGSMIYAHYADGTLYKKHGNLKVAKPIRKADFMRMCLSSHQVTILKPRVLSLCICLGGT